jgi:hypothetical protein
MNGASQLLTSLRSQGRICAALGSPMYGELSERIAADFAAGGIFAQVLTGHEDDPAGLAVPLRLLGGLHRLVLDGRAPALRRWYPSTGGNWSAEAAWPQITAASADHISVLRAALNHPPQTNEVGRAAALIGGLLILQGQFGYPIALYEIGSSAGLNLRADHYRYRFPGGAWGPAGSPVTVDDAWQGKTPPSAALHIVRREGCDIAPLDATTAEGELTLLSYVWPDMTARLDRLRGAIEIARRVPVHVEQRAAAAAVTGLRLDKGTLTVLWHSVVRQYLSADEQAAVDAGIDALAAAADAHSPFAHLTFEPQRRSHNGPIAFLLRVRSWPGGTDRVLAECGPHGPPVVWE